MCSFSLSIRASVRRKQGRPAGVRRFAVTVPVIDRTNSSTGAKIWQARGLNSRLIDE